ncbi:MAG: TIGR00730 family Rossman fold protein [Bacteroidales bacterium]
MKINSVCVYCASSSKINSGYFEAARKLGKLLAENDIECICGAGRKGLMGTLTEEVLASGGSVKGIIPRFMYEEGWYHPQISDLVLTESMHERKTLMAESSDAVIAMPGGCGTMEELLEIITWKQLGLYFNPIIILNTNGYYDPLIQMLSQAIEETFMRPEHGNMWLVAQTPEEAIELLETANDWIENPRKFAAI